VDTAAASNQPTNQGRKCSIAYRQVNTGQKGKKQASEKANSVASPGR
jgi:hypothetical protein